MCSGRFLFSKKINGPFSAIVVSIVLFDLLASLCFAELFDLSLFEGETVREWLFFGKPRRAFDSGNRKQRSLPDYSGRGWHESRKQLVKEYGGQKRSYYMDPQPQSYLEWHLYEYEVNKNEGYTLYRLELKLVVKKKSPKAKVNKESLADIQNKMGKLSAVAP